MASDTEEAPEENHVIDTATLLRTQPLVAGMRRLYCSEDFTDLEIICQERVWKVHKFCLCAQSEFFQSACGGNFLEAANNRISLDGDDPQTVACLIHYLYNFDYINFQQTGLAPIVLDVRMFVIADKYFITPLKELAAKKFEEGAKAWWSTRAFVDAVIEVYDSAAKDSPLKETIIRVVRQHASDLLDTSKGYDYFVEMLGSIPEFGKYVTMALMTSYRNQIKYKCPFCTYIFMTTHMSFHFRCPHCDHRNNVRSSKEEWARYIVED